MKIAIVSDAIYPYNKGGKEKKFFEVSTRLAKKGYKVTIYCMKWWKGRKMVKIENGVALHAISKLYPLYSGERRSIKQAIFFALSCLKLINEDFDVIDVDHMPHLVLFPLKIVCILKRKKMIASWNEVWGRKYWVKYMGILGNFAYAIERLSVLTPNKIISISKHTTNSLKRELSSKTEIATVPMGINLSEINNVKSLKFKSDIIFAGRLLSHKNVDVLIKSISILKKYYPEIRCLIVGEGPEKKNLIKLVKELSLEKNVKFLDFLPQNKDLYSLMKSSKVFVLPSTREGFGIVVIEANACGIPVVTINHKDNAAKDLIKQNENGIVVELNETKLAIAVKRLLKKKNSIDCIKFAKSYDWERIASQTEEVYFPNKSIIVTTSWDDGHKLDLKLAKLLIRYGIKGTFYISPNNCEFKKSKLLSNDDILALSKNFEVGAHTMIHSHLSRISTRETRREIVESKKYLEKVTGKKVNAFCYPYGEYNTKVKQVVEESGFKTARTIERFSTNTGSDRFEISTTVHVYSHLQDLKNWKMLLKFRTIDWEVLAKKQFDYVLKNGGVFHLWGHSWEIEKFNNWQKLERFLKYASSKKEVKYLTNAELI